MIRTICNKEAFLQEFCSNSEAFTSELPGNLFSTCIHVNEIMIFTFSQMFTNFISFTVCILNCTYICFSIIYFIRMCSTYFKVKRYINIYNYYYYSNKFSRSKSTTTQYV